MEFGDIAIELADKVYTSQIPVFPTWADHQTKGATRQRGHQTEEPPDRGTTRQRDHQTEGPVDISD